MRTLEDIGKELFSIIINPTIFWKCYGTLHLLKTLYWKNILHLPHILTLFFSNLWCFLSLKTKEQKKSRFFCNLSNLQNKTWEKSLNHWLSWLKKNMIKINSQDSLIKKRTLGNFSKEKDSLKRKDRAWVPDRFIHKRNSLFTDLPRVFYLLNKKVLEKLRSLWMIKNHPTFKIKYSNWRHKSHNHRPKPIKNLKFKLHLTVSKKFVL